MAKSGSSLVAAAAAFDEELAVFEMSDRAGTRLQKAGGN